MTQPVFLPSVLLKRRVFPKRLQAPCHAVSVSEHIKKKKNPRRNQHRVDSSPCPAQLTQLYNNLNVNANSLFGRTHFPLYFHKYLQTIHFRRAIHHTFDPASFVCKNMTLLFPVKVLELLGSLCLYTGIIIVFTIWW